jgi:hypothetical protein
MPISVQAIAAAFTFDLPTQSIYQTLGIDYKIPHPGNVVCRVAAKWMN